MKTLGWIRLLVLGIAFAWINGCGGSQSGMAPPPTISVAVSPTVGAVGLGQIVQFAATVTGDSAGVTWTVSAGTVDAAGNYTAPAGPGSSTAVVTATSKTDTTKSASATVNVVAAGQFTQTANVQVAQYSVAPAAAGDVSVEFGTDTNYELTTWTQPAPQGGGAVNLLVAGIRASTAYHMRGIVKFKDGSQFTDSDYTFTTGALTAGNLPTFTATTTSGMTPQSGVELLDLINTSGAQGTSMAVTDLQGNVIWAYDQGNTALYANPIKLLPNGHFLMLLNTLGGGDGAGSIIREVDLAGQTIWEMTPTDLNAALATATCAGCNTTVIGAHHDFAILPNGHIILITSQKQTISSVAVLGDVLIDLDENRKPVWIWSEFDHLDTSRQPYLFPDWTHTNAVIYSPDDGALIISIRHQNWLVKINYADGGGDGNVLWRLGYQGDFTLVGGTDPQDWFYAQHGPSFVGTKSAGTFSLVLFDNGDDRGVASGPLCGTPGEPACYSTVPIFQIDETAKTATLTWHPTTPEYSFFGGNAEVLANGNVEYTETASQNSPIGATIYESTQMTPTEIVWKLKITGKYAYRGMRIPSLYPGVQW